MTVRQKMIRLIASLSGFGVFLVFALLASLLVITGPEAEQSEVTEKAWPVSVMTVKPEQLSPVSMTYGRLETRQVAALKTSLSATVARISKPEGAWVEQGELILALDREEAGIALALVEAGLKRSQSLLESVKAEYALAQAQTVSQETLTELAEKNLARFHSLHERGMVSAVALDEVRQQASEQAMRLAEHQSRVSDFPNRINRQQAEVEEAQARVQQARLNLAQTEIRAPFPGRVMQVNIAEGERTMAGSVLVELADYSQLELRTAVTAESAARLQQALAAGRQITATGFAGGRETRFQLDRIAGQIRGGQGGVDALFSTPENNSLVLGSVINLQLHLPVEEKVIVMPVHAVYENDRVYRVRDNRLENVGVERIGDYVDAEGNFRVLIRSDELAPGDTLMTTQLPTAIDGLLVSPVSGSGQSVIAMQ